MSDSAFAPEVRGQAKAFSSLLARSVREFFKDETNRKQFESWYEQKYGTPYQWKPREMHPITHLYHLGDFERRKRLWQMKL